MKSPDRGLASATDIPPFLCLCPAALQVGPHGKMEKITMEQGRRWEGIDLETQDAQPNWKAWLADKQTLFRSETWEKKADKAAQLANVNGQRSGGRDKASGVEL